MSWITIMTLSGRTLFWLISCAAFLRGYADDASHIRGVPGKDYPNYSSIPQTSFRCSEQLHIPGLYADPETRCQVFHHCYEHRQESFLCPLGTVFNQAILACDYWYSADCSAAPLYYGSNSPHQVMIYDAEPGLVPIKNSPDNLLDKMASLYDVNDGFSIPNDSGNEADYHEDNSFSDRELIVQSKTVMKNRNFMENTGHYDRSSIAFNELPEEYEYVQNNEDPEDNIQNFKDSFDGSGQFSYESKELEDDSYLWPSNDKGDFDNQQFAIMHEKHVEEKTKPHDHSYYEDEQNDHLTDFSHVLQGTSKGSFVSEEKLVRRYSENNANPYSIKSVRRKPKFTVIESETKTIEQSKDKVSTPSIDSDDKVRISASTESMSVSNFPESSVTSYKAKRRRKPIVIDLEDTLQYNINSATQPDGGVGVNYEVNSQSEIPGVSIAAQEISVQLIPSEANSKHRPVREHLFNHYNIESEKKTESSTASYVTSPASNIHYEATTFPNFKKFEIRDEEFAANFNVIIPIRKKNKIRIIDSEDNHVGIDDGQQEDTLLPILKFEDGTRLIEKEFQDFEGDSSDTLKETTEISEQPSLKEDEVETDPSYFVTEYDEVKFNNMVPDAHYILQETHNDEQGILFQKSDDLDQSHISHLNNESSLETKQFEDDSEIDARTDSVTFKSLVGFDSTTYDEMQDEIYFTIEPISEISTSKPLEIQNTKDSETKTYSIPQSNFESEYDYSSIFRNTWTPVPITLEGNHVRGLLESGSFDLHPLLEDSIRDETTELPLSEDFELQTIISDSYESDTENEQFPKTELMEHILYQNNRNSVPSMSPDITSNNYAYSEEISTASDIVIDAELIDYLSHSNANLDSSAKLDVILPESKQTDKTVKDNTAKQFSEIQRHLIDETVDFDAMKKQDEGGKNKTTLLELNTNSLHPPKLVNTDILDKIDLKNNEHTGNAESEVNQGVIDLSNDFPESSNQFDFVPPVTTNSILEISENPPFWNNINAFQNDAFNSNQKLSKNADIKADLSHVINDNQFKTFEKPIIKNAKARPLRSSRTLATPYQMGFNMEAFGSQYLSGFPSSVLKLKQSNIQKLLPYSGPAFENGAFYARTGSLLESPKISKLISIGKNLLRSKRAKLRILSRYFKSNQ